jgi:CDGSH-type Zn-finger protein
MWQLRRGLSHLRTGKGVSDRGVLSVVDGDAVLCPCGKNRVIASMNAGCHLERKTEAATGSAANFRNAAAAPSAGKSMGVIAKAGGPRRINHTPHEIVLDGDVLLCRCATSPRMIARMQSTFTHNDMAESMGVVTSSRTASGGVTSVLVGQYDEQVEAKRGASFEGYPYFIQTEDGRVFLGLVDSGQRLPRVPTETSENYTVFWGDDALARQEGN